MHCYFASELNKVTVKKYVGKLDSLCLFLKIKAITKAHIQLTRYSMKVNSMQLALKIAARDRFIIQISDLLPKLLGNHVTNTRYGTSK